MAKFAPFDAADYLNGEETKAEYITAALEDLNPDVFLTAVGMWPAPAAWLNSPKMPALAGKASTRYWPPARQAPL